MVDIDLANDRIRYSEWLTWILQRTVVDLMNGQHGSCMDIVNDCIRSNELSTWILLDLVNG